MEFKGHGLRHGSTVPVIYDPKHPTRCAIGTRQKLWREDGPTDYAKQFVYTAAMAVLALVGAALKAQFFPNTKK